MMPNSDPLRDFIPYATAKLEENLAQMIRCAGLLTDQELWHRPNQHTNSVGNLILHLTGNVRQWILASVGGQHFDRDRPAEFAERGPLPAANILPKLEQTVREALQVLANLDPATLAARHEIQGNDVSTLVAVFHVVEHFSFHTGQAIHATKTLKDVDLSLYDDQGRRISGDRNTP